MISLEPLFFAAIFLLRLAAVDCFLAPPRPFSGQSTARSSTLLSDETIARLQHDYRDLKEALQYQVQYFQQVASDDEEDITEDSLELAAYMAHLQRFQQEQAARLAVQDHAHAEEELDQVREEWEKWHDAKLIQDFEYELAQDEEVKAHDKGQRALRLLGLLEKSEWDLKAALEELRQANNQDQSELYKHQALLRSFKTRLIDHDPFKGSVSF